ncbi:MAG: hypothetical protein EHM72_01015 [Calditrichaeota bacterium]|nr:MAG: hypothetical protein EHM72_01015 [Calditrichota bacterium]
MKNLFKYLIVVFIFACWFCSGAVAQMQGLHGDYLELRDGVHSGNLFRTTFYNDGTSGAINDPSAFAGEWPINSGTKYMIDGNLFVGGEVIDSEGQVKHIMTEVRSSIIGNSTGDRSPDGDWWTFLPLPGFASKDTNKIAMSKWPWAWPYVWPDRIDDPVDPGWPGQWNGYFGKDVYNADEESFFVADDYTNAEFKFYPDSTDLLRRGLGIRMWVRGFQWSNALVEDGLFNLFDLENIGTFNHDKMVFGYKYGNNMGDTKDGGDGGDDMGGFDKESDSAYLYDFDDIGYGGWTPIGYFGGVFLESPGNPYDGIDNDGDGVMGDGTVISESMFDTKTLGLSDPIVVTDYETFERKLTSMAELAVDTLKIPYQDLIFKFWVGKSLQEIPFDLVDNNLNGIIDENNGAVVGEGADAYTSYLYVGLKAIDYYTGAGRNNILLDERRNDGIDNDGDWDPAFDDLGADGVAFSGDPGESDGIPSNGEPHFDKTDVDETDMIGLTSFSLYVWENLPQYDDEKVWTYLLPGFFDDELLNANIELLYGSGYFPVKAGTIERFSMGTMCGINRDDYLENVKWFTKAYGENYNFAKAPNIPTVQAIPGDHRVTLIWDNAAEESEDPITGKDFEGYKIYRSTDPGWNDAMPITDGQGVTTYRKPIVQFDLANDISGYAPVDVKGIKFNLGNNTGIVNTWTDSTVVNGQTYFYAVTSYDRGSAQGGLAPSECSKFITLNTAGVVQDKGKNVVVVRPEAPTNGMVPTEISGAVAIRGGQADSKIGYKVINPLLIKDKNKYQISFEDTMLTGSASTLTYVTKNMTLVNVTNPSSPDTLIKKSPNVKTGDVLPITEGFQVILASVAELGVRADSSMWSRDSVYAYVVEPFLYGKTRGVPLPFDYEIEFGPVGMDTSTELSVSATRKLPAIPVNFSVTNLVTGKKIDFGFWENDKLAGQEGTFTAFTDKSRTDQIIFIEPDVNDSTVISWSLELDSATNDSLHNNPRAGDYLIVKTVKPFMASDVYEFETSAQYVNEATIDLEKIRVVPNPYVVTNSWEPLNPYSNGRGPRELHFTHLPPNCTIKIFNVRGQLVAELEYHAGSDILDGTLVWNMLTKDNLDIAYGIYIYHVDAGENGAKIGKFAIIK